jgi:uncharacterized membrane protein YgcG
MLLIVLGFVPMIARAAPGPVAMPAGTRAMVNYPILAPGQTTYVVQPNEATLIIDTLYIPQGVTLVAGPGVTSILWNVNTLKFDANATINLSASQTPPPKAPDGGPPPGQADYCTAGSPGSRGSNGALGANAANLVLQNIAAVDNGGGQGSLWIRTDGGPGGNGGNGGQGQQGGGQHRWGSFPPHFCHAAMGGGGGSGGAAGAGGHLSNVNLFFTLNPAPNFVTGVAAVCGPSQRPPAVQGASGQIVIWGGPGCAGSPGPAGPNGGGG